MEYRIYLWGICQRPREVRSVVKRKKNELAQLKIEVGQCEALSLVGSMFS
jgi:hypothetical protein